MKKADMPVDVKGNNNDIKIQIVNNNINITEPSKTPVAIVIAFTVIAVVTILAVSYCCPEMLAEFVRCIISIGKAFMS